MKALLAKIDKNYRFRHAILALGARVLPERQDVRRFKGIGRGQRCFIMGNGPSLKRIDPLRLKREVTFGTNGIYLVEDWLGFLPTYHVTEDRLVIEDRGAEISALRGTTKFYDRRWMRHIPPSDSDVMPRVIYDYSEYPDFPLFSRNAARCLWVGGTVTYLCLQLAYYMEYDPVILVGFDHSYVRPAHVEAAGAVWTSHGDDPNHIHPDYFGKGKRWHDPRVDRMSRAFIRAKNEFESAGRRVVNATSGGQLEIFPRADFLSLFK